MGAPSRRFAFFRQRLTHALTLKLGLGDGDRAMLNFAPSSLRSGFFTRSACFPSSSSLFVSSYRGVALQFPKGKREGDNPKQPLITCIPYTGIAHAFSLSLERLFYKILGQGGERRIAPSNIPIWIQHSHFPEKSVSLPTGLVWFLLKAKGFISGSCWPGVLGFDPPPLSSSRARARRDDVLPLVRAGA